jgi:SAM-dependent methyltransferase
MFNKSTGVEEVGLSPYPSTTTIRTKSEQDKECAEYVRALSRPGYLLDIGCHDGYFLSLMRDLGWSVRGCEPSSYAAVARNNYGLKIDQAFFDADLYHGEQFDLVTARNVLCLVPNPRKFLQDCNEVLRPEGLLVVETINPQTWYRLETIAFGHEAQYYFDHEHIRMLAARQGFYFVDMRKGYRMYLVFRKSLVVQQQVEVIKRPIEHNTAAMEQYANDYRRNLEKIRKGLKQFLARWRQEKLSFCIYGAGTHTQFLLAMLNLKDGDITYIVDSDPLKCGKFLAGSRIKVVPPSAIQERGIDAVLVSSGPYQDEIIKQLRKMNVNSRIVRIYPEPAYVPE